MNNKYEFYNQMNENQKHFYLQIQIIKILL